MVDETPHDRRTGTEIPAPAVCEETLEDTQPGQPENETLLPGVGSENRRLNDVPSRALRDVQHLMSGALWLTGGFIPILLSTLNGDDDSAWLPVPPLQGLLQS